MTLSRLNRILMSGIAPFNFGMDYDGWVELYNNSSLRGLCPSDPSTWSEGEREAVNKVAKEETELVDRLMRLSPEEFSAEVDRLEKGE